MSLSTLKALFNPFLDLVQIDVTTRGPWTGDLVLRRAYKDQWIVRDFDPDMMRALRPVLKRTKICHLQGWGEPLLNPNFFELIRIAKGCNCTVTTAFSDGSLVDESTAEKITTSGLSSITLSISSLKDQDNLARRGTNLASAFQALEEIKRRKPLFGDSAPVVNVLYNLHRSDLDELRKFPALFQGLGVTALILNPLSITPDSRFEDDTLVPADPEELQEITDVIKDTAKLAGKRDMQLLAFIVNGGKKPPKCIENLGATSFVDAAGAVAPCIFSRPPLQEDTTYRFQGMDLLFFRLGFGDITRAPFKYIWHSEAYAEFRRQYKHTGVPEACAGCWRPYIEPVKI